MRLKNFPQLFRFLIISVCGSVLLYTVMRIVFWIIFNEPDTPLPNHDIAKAFFIGWKFDLRLALLVHLPILLLGSTRRLNLFTQRKFWMSYLTVLQMSILFTYFIDIGHFAYLQTRINATVLRFLYNLKDSLTMIWESYPVILYIGLFGLLIAGYGYGIIKTIDRAGSSGSEPLPRKKKVLVGTVFVFIYIFGIYGKLSYYPLRWSDAFFSTHYFISAVTLNPVLYLFDTYKNKDSKFDLATVNKSYDTMAHYLGVSQPDKDTLNYTRSHTAKHPLPKPVNIVLVLLESFAYYKTGLSGNPLSPTPNFDELSQTALLFTRYYTPHGGTARSVFTTVTGLPDVELNKTSSRNPLIVQQHTIINAFKGYEKFYFLGGSANWGEIRGLLSHNIKGLHIYEEGSYASKRVDVWGISDLSLFKEANAVLSKVSEQPFFAMIHTAGNHEPYTIPDDNHGFQMKDISDEQARKYGFKSSAALNSFRFMDHSIGEFIKMARKEPYFNNTIFAFYGDHGLHRRAKHMHPSEDLLLLGKHHVPLLIYAPGLITKGKTYDMVASSTDLLPTIASMASVNYVNTTIGRNLLDNRFNDNRYAFTIYHHGGPTIGLIGEHFYFQSNLAADQKKLYDIFSENPAENVIGIHPQTATQMENLCNGIYETTRYMRFHNSEEDIFNKKATSTTTKMD